MRKLLLTALLIGAFAVHGPAQLLYRISGNGLQQPSYIIGTFHLANVGFVDKIPGVREAMTATRQVCGEVVWADMTNADTLKAVQSFMLLPDGKRLRDVLTAEQYQRVDGCLKSLLGAGLDNPQVAAQMGSMSPAALSAQLTVLQYMARHIGEFDPTSTFDQYFQAQATHNNELVRGLESVSFQAGILYRSMPMARQVEQLLCFVDHLTAMSDMTESIAKAFYAQDLDAMKQAMDKKMGNACDATDEEMETLVYNRNSRWLMLMPSMMQQMPTFFVVGAGHLPGSRGVLQGLRQLGYTVEGVK